MAQLGFILCSSLCFIVAEISLLSGECKTNKIAIPDEDCWQSTLLSMGNFFFNIQYILFILGYVRILLVIPYTFCLQSDSVVRSLQLRMRIFTIIKASLIFISIGYEVLKIFLQKIGSSHLLLFSTYHITVLTVLTISMVVSLRKIQKLQRKISITLCDEKLLWTHCASFSFANLLEFVQYLLGLMTLSVTNKAGL